MKKIFSLILAFTMLFSVTSYAATDEPSSWAEDGIGQLRETKYFREEAFKNYKNDITREEFIYLAVRVYEIVKGEVTADPNISFSDTDDIYALKGATVGITTGVGNGKFAPDQKLTREQLAVLMVNTLELAKLDLKESDDYKFVDENEFSSWAKSKIYLAKKNGIIGGIGNDKFDSQGYATVEQALIITNKILVAYPDSRANGVIAHIIDIYPEDATDEIVDASKHNFREDEAAKELMSKYGTLPKDGNDRNFNVSVKQNGFAYYNDTYAQSDFADIRLAITDNQVELDIADYSDKIKEMVVDFMTYAYPADNGHIDALNKAFADIESKESKDITTGEVYYATKSLVGKSFDVGNVNVEYDKTTESFIVRLTIN